MNVPILFSKLIILVIVIVAIKIKDVKIKTILKFNIKLIIFIFFTVILPDIIILNFLNIKEFINIVINKIDY